MPDICALREFQSESNLSYYRARYYDPSTARFISEDPTGFDADENFYRYVHNNSVNSVDPFGLDGGDTKGICAGGYCAPSSYLLKPGVPAPSPALDRFLKCLSTCIGTQVLVTATTPVPGEKHQDPGHAAGTSLDIRPVDMSKGGLFCCAGKCGASWGLDEGPGGQTFKFTQGYNYHFQLVPPRHPSPKAPNSIPSNPNCKPPSCRSSR